MEQLDAAAHERPRVVLSICGLAVMSLALFVSTWAPTIQYADSGELVAAACNGGVAHPPGYPLYSMLARGFCALPMASPARAVGLLSILCGVFAVICAFLTVHRLTRQIFAGLLAAAVLMTAPLFWRYAGTAEVFALHVALNMAMITASVYAVSSERNKRWIFIAGLFGGLALANHHSSVFVGLVPLAAIISAKRRLPALLWGTIGVVCGLMPYLYLLAADAHAVPRWGDTSTWAGLVHHVLRRDYGTFQLALGHQASPMGVLLAFAGSLPRQLGWFLVVLLLPGGVVLLRRKGDVAQPLRLAIVAAIVLTGPVFLLMFNIPAQGIGRQVAERFFILPNALLALVVGLGAAAVIRFLGPMRQQLVRVVVVALAATFTLYNYTKADASDDYIAEDYAYNVLQTVAPHALILGQGDVRLFAITYLQEVLGERRDVQYLDVRMLGHKWYVEQHKRRYPQFDYEHTGQRIDSLGLINRALKQRRPVYLAVEYNDRVRRAFVSYPLGPLRHLVTQRSEFPDVAQLVALNHRVYRRYRRRSVVDAVQNPWGASLIEPFAATWETIVSLYLKRGDRGRASRARALAMSWAPWLDLKPLRPPKMAPSTKNH